MASSKHAPRCESITSDDSSSEPALDMKPSDDHSDVQSWRHRFFMALPWLALIFGTVVVASVGPVFKYIMSEYRVNSTIACVWRNQSIILSLFIPFGIVMLQTPESERSKWFADISDAPNKDNTAPLKKRSIWVYLVGIAFNWFANLSLFVKSLAYTTAVRATIFASLGPVFLMLYARLWLGVNHTMGEILGLVISLAGVAMSLLDEKADSQSAPNQLLGDGLALSTAVLASLNLVFISRVRQQMHVVVYLFTSISLVTCFFMLMALTVEGSSLFGSDSNSVFGWLVDHTTARSFLLLGFIVGFGGMLGQNFSLRFIPPLLFSVVSLMSTPLTAVMVWVAGIESIPKKYTIIGGSATLIGILTLIVCEAKRKESEAAETLAQPPSTSQTTETPSDVSTIVVDNEQPSLNFREDVIEFAMHDFSLPASTDSNSTMEANK
jgi:drug/metabolite transporter (DMT)-like permease